MFEWLPTTLVNLRRRLDVFLKHAVDKISLRKSRLETDDSEPREDGRQLQHFPPELLEIIFDYLERSSSSFILHRTLHPLLLVCRTWYISAIPRLYRSVSLGLGGQWSPPKGDLEVRKDMACELFLRTVQNNKELALLVRELRLGFDDQDISHHADVLRLCTNIDRLEISQFGGVTAGLRWFELKDALEHVDPIEFSFSQVPGERMPVRAEIPGTYSPSTLLACLGNWSRLQKVVLYDVLYRDVARHNLEFLPPGDDHLDAQLLPDPSSTKALSSCPGLRKATILIRDTRSVHPGYLLLLSKIAPNLNDISIQSGRLSDELPDVLRRCLRTWSPTLTHLSLLGGSILCPIDNVCPCLTSLRFLSVYSTAIRPDSLLHLINLEFLYYCSSPNDARQLAFCMRGAANLPSLQNLIIIPSAVFPESDRKQYCDYVSTIRDICRDRNIDFPEYCWRL